MQDSMICHYTLPNIKRLMGEFDKTFSTSDENYYNLAFRGVSHICACKESITDRVYNEDFEKLSNCPKFITCQSFKQWKSMTAINYINRFFDGKRLKASKLKISILPIGPFPPFITRYKSPTSGLSVFELICEFLRVFFTGCDIELLPVQDISLFSCKNRKHNLTGMPQYLANDFFPQLKSLLSKNGFCIVGISWHDLYPCEELNFVLGQASAKHYCCIASFGRFDPTYIKGFHGNTDGIAAEDMCDITEIDNSLLWKLFKVVAHETCHVFGLSHCGMFSCLMNESKSTKEVVNQPLYLCPVCLKKIHYACSNWSQTKNLFQVQIHLAGLMQFLHIVFPLAEIQMHTNYNLLQGTAEYDIANTTSWITKILHKMQQTNHRMHTK